MPRYYFPFQFTQAHIHTVSHLKMRFSLLLFRGLLSRFLLSAITLIWSKLSVRSGFERSEWRYFGYLSRFRDRVFPGIRHVFSYFLKKKTEARIKSRWTMSSKLSAGWKMISLMKWKKFWRVSRNPRQDDSVIIRMKTLKTFRLFDFHVQRGSLTLWYSFFLFTFN